MRVVLVCALCAVLSGCNKSETDDEQASGPQPVDADATSASVETDSASVPAPKEVKADTVQIAYAHGTKMIGGIQFELGADLSLGEAEPAGPVTVMIFRQIAPQDLETARRWGVKVGGAYIQKGPTEFEYIRDVDLSLSDEELAAQFGVETGES